MFQWQRTARNQYSLLSEAAVYGSLSFSLERSILFIPDQREYYRASSVVDGRTSHFKCLFRDGQFRGCIAVEEGESQSFAFFEPQPARVMRRQVSWIMLPEGSGAWLWLPGHSEGHWVVRGGGQRILEVKSAMPDLAGTIHVYHPELLYTSYGPSLIHFCAYLAIGPHRPSLVPVDAD
jgi:hypothetical protein